MEIGRSKMNFVLRGFRSCRIAYYRLRMRAFSYTRGHRSRDKGGGHTIRSAITINTKNATRKLHHRTGVIEDLHWGIGIFDLLLLWAWPWPHDLANLLRITWRYSLRLLDVQIWTSCASVKNAFERYRLTDRQTSPDKQTDIQTRPNTTPLRGWSKISETRKGSSPQVPPVAVGSADTYGQTDTYGQMRTNFNRVEHYTAGDGDVVSLFRPFSRGSKLSQGSHRYELHPNGVETLRKISIAWVGCAKNVTDDRQTTDGRAIANVNVS